MHKNKSPGFWFFVGDWMKDPELRFCSLFARGLLVDLLCLCFESKEQGFLSRPDGTARSDSEIVDAISGATREEKLAALAELERSGCISRDSRGVLFSRRLARLAEISQTRSKAGSKGGSKTEAKQVANTQAKAKQNLGVSVSVSDSVSDSFINTLPPLSPKKFDPAKVELPSQINTSEMQNAWRQWCRHRVEIKKPLKPTMVEQQLRQFSEWGESRSVAAILHTISRGWQGLQEPEAKRNGKAHNPDLGDLF